jgi:hypothetical protein
MHVGKENPMNCPSRRTLLIVLAVAGITVVLAAPRLHRLSAEEPSPSRAVIAWEYAKLGRVPLGSDLRFESPKGTMDAATIEELSVQLGGKKERSWVVLTTAIGAQGWELIAVAPDAVSNGSFATCYFKRPTR